MADGFDRELNPDLRELGNEARRALMKLPLLLGIDQNPNVVGNALLHHPEGLAKQGLIPGYEAPAAVPTIGTVLLDSQQYGTQQQNINRQFNFAASPFIAGTAAFLLRPGENRYYFLLQNNSATATLYLGLGYSPTTLTGIQIPPGGNYEPLCVPQNDVWVLGSAANLAGVIVYAVS